MAAPQRTQSAPTPQAAQVIFARLPIHLRPARVESATRRASAQQTAAWRRLGEWLIEETTQRALRAATSAATSAADGGLGGQEA
jgi:hypothetical protein